MSDQDRSAAALFAKEYKEHLATWGPHCGASLATYKGHLDVLLAAHKKHVSDAERDVMRTILNYVRFNLVGPNEYPPVNPEACQYNIRNAVGKIDAVISGIPK